MNKQMSNKLKKHINLIKELTLENILLKHTIETLEKEKTETMTNKRINKSMGLHCNKKTPKVLLYIHKKFF